MASIKHLKKDINYVLGDIIDAVLMWELSTGNQKSEQGTALIQEIIAKYDDFMSKISDRNAENRGVYLKSVRKDFEVEAGKLVEKLNGLR